MEIERLFEKLDIDSPEDFKYYENFETLMEDDEHIEEELIKEALSQADSELLSDHLDHFFESFISNIPEDETELYIIIDSFKGNLANLLFEDMGADELSELASEIYKFRRWYVIDHNAKDMKSGEELSVRDARYEIMAAKFLGETKEIDFGRAITSGPDAYSVKLKDIIE